MDRNRCIQLCWAINSIREENNKKAIQRNKFSMRKEMLYNASKHGEIAKPYKFYQIITLHKRKSDTKMSYENRGT